MDQLEKSAEKSQEEIKLIDKEVVELQKEIELLTKEASQVKPVKGSLKLKFLILFFILVMLAAVYNCSVTRSVIRLQCAAVSTVEDLQLPHHFPLIFDDSSVSSRNWVGT